MIGVAVAGCATLPAINFEGSIMTKIRALSVIILLAALAIFPHEKAAGGRPSEINSSPGEGAITGTIAYAGRLPTPRQIDMSSDPFCGRLNTGATTPDVVITDGRLANAFVFVTGAALKGRTFEPPSSPAMLEHKSCMLVPRVLGIQTGQTLKILNADATTHVTNVQPSGPVESWNISQEPGSPPVERLFTKQDLFTIVTDKQHSWETAYLLVLPHPFFSVSGPDGSYRMTGLPPGRYKMVVWHEKFGKKIMEVSVDAGESKAMDLTFAGIEEPASELTIVIPPHGTIEGGILNNKTLVKPDPVYPPRAKAAGITGGVTVAILIDEEGNVVRARALGGPLPLQQAAVSAAYQAKFPPTLVSGQPVKVRGAVVYSFKLK